MNLFYDSNTLLLIVLALWTIPWKIYAVWLAAKHDHKKWFIALLILNTVGILEIFYIFKIANKSWVEVKRDFGKAGASLK
ncbi:hypothetical protein HYW73_00350 [Candidatus Nomurabacteria bacterium]|nr:hypothetical protein [Candidatus Nomurabacteria bacterium]